MNGGTDSRLGESGLPGIVRGPLCRLRRRLDAPWSAFACDDRPVEPVARVMVFTALALLAMGVLMVYSASSARALAEVGDDGVLFRKQVTWAVAAIGVLFVTMRVDVERVAKWAWWAGGLALVGLLWLILARWVPALQPQAPEINGARRWWLLGPVRMQVGELAKLVMIVLLAWRLAHLGRRAHELVHGVVLTGLIVVVPTLLVQQQPDLGTAALLGFVGLILLLVGGIPLRRLTAFLPLVAPFVVYNLHERWDTIVRRFAPFLGQEGGERDALHQLTQSLTALGAGGWFGRGVGAGRQKLFYLPEAQTDFILPVVGEELGFLGTVAVVLLYMLFVVCGLRIVLAAAARDRYLYLLTFGIVLMIGLQASLNVAVVTGSVPTKGIPLPFVSLGGSSLLTLSAALGLVYAAARRMDAMKSGHAAAPSRPVVEPRGSVIPAVGGAT